MTVARRLGAAAVWLVAALAIALGAAGLVTAMDPPPTDGGRTDLTTSGDAEVRPALDAVEADIGALATSVDALGTQARGALAALTASDHDTVDAAIATGDDLLIDIQLQAAKVRSELGDVPLVGTPEADYRVSMRSEERRVGKEC